MSSTFVRLKTAHRHIKTVKTAVETRNRLVRPLSIKKSKDHPGLAIITVNAYESCEQQTQSLIEDKTRALQFLQILDLEEVVELVDFESPSRSHVDERVCPGIEPVPKLPSRSIGQANAVTDAIYEWLHGLPHDLGCQLDTTSSSLLKSAAAARFQIYQPMLLLSTGAFQSPEWQSLLKNINSSTRNTLFAKIARSAKVTHIASNSPIPAEVARESNVIRSPTALRILYGDFGPYVSEAPRQADFDAALWVTAVQNQIRQVWAPRYTMFSRGNVSEKHRLLRLPSVMGAVEEGKRIGAGCAAVDLYAGIGYFAFSYVKAGVDTVLCFEINPWSVEGLQRGVEANGWDAAVLRGEAVKVDCTAVEALESASISRVVAVEASNENAAAVVRRYRHHIPPIRHVNCGLLPTSRQGWQTAVDCVDPLKGGWIHVHENLAVGEINGQAQAILTEIEGLAKGRSGVSTGSVELEHVQQVKTYAPGVMHCVLDIYIPPSESSP